MRGNLLMTAGAAVVLTGAAAACAGLFLPDIPLVATGPRSRTAIALIGVVLATWPGRILLTHGRRHLARDGWFVMDTDPRPPVVYLRTFAIDHGMARYTATHGIGPDSQPTEEEQTGRAFASFGPMMAIGRPDEPLPQLGAAKITSADDWQELVSGLLRSARLVVIAAGTSSGIEWELRETVRHVAPEKIVLLLPFDEPEYENFRGLSGPVFPKSLPDYPSTPAGRRLWMQCAIYFRPDWTPRIVHLDQRTSRIRNQPLEARLVNELRPVFQQCGVPWKPAKARPVLRIGSHRKLRWAWPVKPDSSHIVRETDPPRLVIYSPRRKILLVLIASIAFAAVSAPMLLAEAVVAVVGFSGVIFSGACGIAAGYRLAVRRPLLVADAHGLYDHATALGAGALRWDEIVSLRCIEIRGRPMLTVVVTDPEAVIRRAGRWKRTLMRANVKLAGSPVSIPQTALPMTVDALRDELRTYQP